MSISCGDISEGGTAVKTHLFWYIINVLVDVLSKHIVCLSLLFSFLNGPDPGPRMLYASSIYSPSLIKISSYSLIIINTDLNFLFPN